MHTDEADTICIIRTSDSSAIIPKSSLIDIVHDGFREHTSHLFRYFTVTSYTYLFIINTEILVP